MLGEDRSPTGTLLQAFNRIITRFRSMSQRVILNRQRAVTSRHFNAGPVGMNFDH